MQKVNGSCCFLMSCQATRCDGILFSTLSYLIIRGWSGDAMVLGKLPVPGRLTYLDKSRPRAFCACSKCGSGLFWTFVFFFSRLSFLFFLPLSERRPDID